MSKRRQNIIEAEVNSKGVTLSQTYHTSEKMENETICVETAKDVSVSASTDGTVKSSMEAGSQIKTENMELGAGVSASSTSSENSEENAVGAQASAGVKIADGMKMKNSVTMQYTDKFSETEEALIEEETESVAFQSRIEVDPQQASFGKKVFAGMYNTGMKAAESGINSMLSSSFKTEILKAGEEGEESGKENTETEQETAGQEEYCEESYEYDYGMGY